MREKLKLYFETITCVVLGIAVLTIPTFHPPTSEYLGIPPSKIAASWVSCIIVASALFTIAFLKVQKHRVRKSVTESINKALLGLLATFLMASMVYSSVVVLCTDRTPHIVSMIITVTASDMSNPYDETSHMVTVLAGLPVPDMSGQPYWWDTSLPVKVKINKNTIPGNLDKPSVVVRLKLSLEEWDKYTSKWLFDSNNIGECSDTSQYGQKDGINSVAFTQLGDTNVGIVQYWYDSNPNSPTYRKMSECDMRLDVDRPWSLTILECSLWCIDLQSVMTHEAGHCLHTPDLYESYYSGQTMYYIIYYGTVYVRSLADVDKAMLKTLYGV